MAGGCPAVVPGKHCPAARCTAAGLTAYDAAYVTVAEQTSAKLMTGDALIPALIPEIAEALGRSRHV
jgi:hypothetical protein